MKSLFRLLAIPLLFLSITQSVYATKSGNKCHGMCKTGGDPFNPSTGNMQRVVRDLEVWGGVGQTTLEWIRYGNSRSSSNKSFFGEAHNWNASYMYAMSDDGTSDGGQPQVVIAFPDEGDYIFVQDATDLSHWVPDRGVGMQLFQDGSNFYLQLANGYRYRFEKLVDNSGATYYQLQDFRDEFQNLYSLSYDSKKRLIQITEPAGRFLAIDYAKVNGKAVITQVHTSDGRSVHYNYDVFNDGVIDWVRLVSVDYGDGTHATYEYSQTASGLRPHISHAIDPRCKAASVNMKFTYADDVEGFIREEINGVTGEVMVTLTANTADKIVCYANGRIDVYHEPSKLQGDPTEMTDGLGRVTQYTYRKFGGGFLYTETDALGRVTTFDSKTMYGNALKTTYPDGTVEKWTRDDLDLILTHTDELGRVTTNTRDANHRVTRIDYPDGAFETFTYNNFGEVLDHQMRNGGIEHMVYDNRGLKTSFTDALGNVTLYTYDSADRLASVTDARGNTTSYEYNERGLLLTMTNADATSQTYTYDDFGDRTSTTDEAGHTWSKTYDEFKRVVSMTEPLGRITLYFYDLPGNICGCTHEENKPTKITLPSGRSTEIAYDVEWEKISETVGAGTADAATTSYEYDSVGNLHVIIDPRENPWTYEYDLRNRKISATDPLTHQTQWTYDAVGNNISMIRADNGITTNVYDDMNRLTQTTDPKGEVTKFKYDAEGNMTKLIDANNHNYNFEYDLLNRKAKMIYPGGTFEAWAYDAVSNVHTYTNRNSDVRTYTYDNRNREILSDWSDNTPDVTSTYSSDNLLLTMSSSESALTYTYNAAHELLSETQAPAGATAHIISYTYNADGLRSTMTNPDASIVSYDYTGRNQFNSIAVNAAPALATYAYDLNGNRIHKTLENGTFTDYNYDDANRVLTIDHQNSSGSFARFDYGYDNVNRRTYLQRDLDKGDVYAYDAIDQVTDVKYDVTDPAGAANNPDRSVNYDYDFVGNRNTVTDNAVTANYTANAKNEYTNVGGSGLMYNANGDLKTYNGWTYTYDAQDRMTKATNGITTVNFKYDPRNRCVKRTINGTKTFFYFDNWNLIEERNSSDVQLARYVNGAMIDEILSKTSAGSSVYYQHDALGTVVKLTDDAGAVTEQYSYDIFGAPTIKEGSGNVIDESAFGNRFMFTGREFIQDVGFYDYRNRFYSPFQGRFFQVDPLRFSTGEINLYRYGMNNPIEIKDAAGLWGGVWGDPPYLYEGTIPEGSVTGCCQPCPDPPSPWFITEKYDKNQGGYTGTWYYYKVTQNKNCYCHATKMNGGSGFMPDTFTGSEKWGIGITITGILTGGIGFAVGVETWGGVFVTSSAGGLGTWGTAKWTGE